MGEEGVESDIISVSPEIVTSKGGNIRRNSTGQAIARTSLSSSNGTENVLPHYLRASTNSCHDFCKYGRKHAFEAKGKCRIPRKVIGDMGTSVELQDQSKNVNLGGSKKKSLIKLKATPELKIELPEKHKIIKQEASPYANKIDVSTQATPELKIKLPEKLKIIKQKASPSANKIEVSIKPGITSKQRSVTAKSPSPSNLSRVPSSRSSSMNSPWNPSRGLNGRRNSDNISMSLSGGMSVGKNSENPSSRLSSGRNSETHSSSPSRGSLVVRRNSEKNIVKNIGWSKIGEKKALKPLVASSSPKPSVTRVTSITRAASPMMNRSRAGKAEPSNEEIMDKTLYVIEPKPECKNFEAVEHDETVNRSSQSSLLLSSLSSYPSLSSDEEEEDDEESESEFIEGENTVYKLDKTGKNGAEDSKGGDKRRLRRSAVIHPEDSVPQKSRFQRGKVVSLETQNNSPRRLRFRPGRVVGDNQKTLDSENSFLKRFKLRQGRVVGVNLSGKADIGRRSFKKNRDLGDCDVNATKAETLVVLRHQDAQGKKEEQGLLNDVIEETANKLVETRKSKVKALVGAFETVISLQESKPATTF